MKADEWTLELRIAYFLRYGVIVAGLTLLVGWLMNASWHQQPSLSEYHPVPLRDTLHLLVEHQSTASLILYAGLGLLISLPVVRVFLTAFIFIRQREYLLAALALLVLFVLLLSMVLGFED